MKLPYAIGSAPSLSGHAIAYGWRSLRDQTSPGEERGNETGKVVIAHGSVEFCEATPIGLLSGSIYS